MTLATWGGMKAELLADTNRASDATFSLRIPRFLEQALQRIHRGGDAPLESPPLRVAAMRLAADLTFTAGAATMPVGFLEADTLEIITEPKSYPTYVPPFRFARQRATATIGYPARYTVSGNTIEIDPPLSGVVGRMYYYGKFTTPSNDADTGWLFTDAPSVLFEALRMEAYQYLRNAEQVQTAFATFRSAIGGLNNDFARAKTSGGPLYPRTLR